MQGGWTVPQLIDWLVQVGLVVEVGRGKQDK